MEPEISVERNHKRDVAPEVTVVVPCYNYAEYVPGAVQSIADQTFQNLEVIIVNDGSTDDTLDVARELLETYRGKLFITLVDQQNQGHPSVTKNTGYSYAEGDFYFTLDSDDMIKPEYVAKVMDTFEKHPDVDVVYPGYQTFGATDWIHIPPDFDFDSLKYWDYIPYSAVFRKEVYERIGGYNDSPSLRIMEDWDFWLRAYGEGFIFKPIKEALLLHRTHPGSLFTSTGKKPFFAANVRLDNMSLFDDFDMEWARRILDSDRIEPFDGTKILFIIDHFPPDVGGAERFAEELGLEFAKLGFLVDVATLGANREFYYYNGLNVFEFEYEIGPYEATDDPRFGKLNEFVKNGDYDLVLVKGGIRNWAIWSLEEPEKYPTVFVPLINKDSVDFLDGEEETRKRLVERLKSAKAVVGLTMTGHDSEFYCENDIPFSVIPNAVDFVSPTIDFKSEMGIPPDTKLLLCVGSYYRVKNQAWLIESLRHMPGNWVLVMMGRVINEPYHHHILSEARGDHRFLILPPQDKGVVASAMEQADLLLLPSQAEAFGRVVLEAMSHRLPWIASTNCTGLKELKGGKLVQLERGLTRGVIPPAKRGWVVQDPEPVRSPFVEEVRGLLSDQVERERLGEEGYREWKDNYRWRNFLVRYLEVTGLEPDPARAVSFRRNSIDPKPARPDYIDLLRAENKASPLVSVVLITYNRPDLLKTALGSVLEQTYEDLEVIVVNDGGLDVSQIVEQFDDPRITCVQNQKNLGAASARNIGIGSAKGKYIAYLDDDDRYYPTHLETLVRALESSRVRFAYTDSYWRAVIKQGDRWCRKSKDVLYSEDFDRDTLFADNYIPIICVMHDVELFEDAGYFDEGLQCLEDWDLWIRMAMHCDFKHIEEITCEVSNRIKDGNSTNDRLKSVKAVTKVINSKYDGLVFRARDLVNVETQSLLRRFEIRKQHSVTDALDYLEWWLEAYVESPRLEYICAQIYRDREDLVRTKHHLKRCLALDPSNRQASRDLTLVDQELKDGGSRAKSTAGPSDQETGEKPVAEPGDVSRRTPIIVPVVRPGQGAIAAVEQLAAVTDNYSLMVVNNGGDDGHHPEGYDQRLCLESTDSRGMTRSINEAIRLLSEEYIAVLRSDVLLYDEGWLDNIIAFMNRREDVGLVGIGGWHSLTEQGVPDLTTSVLKLRGHPDSNRPTWRFTEVAAIDDAGWVMRNNGVRLSEAYRDESLFALDLSLAYIKAGFRVYVAAVEFAYSEDREDVAERFALIKTGRREDLYGMREDARLAMQTKWAELLPLTRGFYDESYVMNRVEELANYARSLEAIIATKDDALTHLSEHEAQLERALATRRAARLKEYFSQRLKGKPTG